MGEQPAAPRCLPASVRSEEEEEEEEAGTHGGRHKRKDREGEASLRVVSKAGRHFQWQWLADGDLAIVMKTGMVPGGRCPDRSEGLLRSVPARRHGATRLGSWEPTDD